MHRQMSHYLWIKQIRQRKLKVNIAYIKDLVVEVPAQIQKGVTMELPVTGTYYGDDGNVQNGVSVTYTAKTEGITLNGNEISVPLSYERNGSDGLQLLIMELKKR